MRQAIARPEAPPGDAHEAALPLRKSLRARGLFATLALLAYLVAAGLYIAYERMRISDSVQGLENLARHEKAVALAEAAVGAALVDVKEASTAERGEPDPPTELRRYIESCSTVFAALEQFDPGYARLQRAIARSYDALRVQPARAHWVELGEALARAAAELEIRHTQLSDQRDTLVATYRRAYDAVTVESLALGVIGLVTFGSFAAWFFTRLAHDISRLETHARQIVQGRRGAALDVRREDELGRLMQAVNRMSVTLDEREQALALEGQRRSHQDKMMAVGALAAGVAHEVNNPLAVIVGSAQALRADATSAEVAQHAEQILAQAQRAAQAARQLADVAAPQPSDIDWFDLDGLVRQVLRWIAYDKRWRNHRFDLQTEPGLPAVRGSASTVQQVLMQLMPPICEAAAHAEQPPHVAIEITAATVGTVQVRLRFQGFPGFTRDDAQRTLALGRAALAPLAARIALDQTTAGGAQVTLSLPLENHAASAPSDHPA